MAENHFCPGVHRPRNVDWQRAAALLYGDWGTSKALCSGWLLSPLDLRPCPIILAVCLLTAIVGFNYIIVCAHFPDGGGVYSAARQQSRFLASVGALLLIANFIVTAALSALGRRQLFWCADPVCASGSDGGHSGARYPQFFRPKT